MKKILGIVLLAFLFSFVIGFSYAQEINEEEYLGLSNDLDKYSQTTFSLKIRFTHLSNTIDYKIDQINYVITRLEDENIDTSQVIEKLSGFEVLIDRIDEIIESDEFLKEDLVLEYVSLKKESLQLVSETREIIREIIPLELHQEIKSLYGDQRKEVREGQREIIQNLVRNHNLEMKIRMNNNFNDFKNQFCNENDCLNDMPHLKQNFENKMMQEKVQRNIQNRENISQNIQAIKIMNQERREIMQNRMNNMHIGGNR